MDGFKIYTPESAPPAAHPMLPGARASRGSLPNILVSLAESSATLNSHASIACAVKDSKLLASKRELVIVAAAAENDCHYCTPVHIFAAHHTDQSLHILYATRAGRRVDDARLEALRRFTVSLIQARGWVSDAEVQNFLDAGFTQAEVLDVVALVAMKTLSTYANHITETPLDPEHADDAFVPRKRAA